MVKDYLLDHIKHICQSRPMKETYRKSKSDDDVYAYIEKVARDNGIDLSWMINNCD